MGWSVLPSLSRALRVVAVPVVILAAAVGTGPAAAEDLVIADCFLRLRHEALIPAEEAGVIRKIVVAPGDDVQIGQTLATLHDTQARLALDTAEIDLEIAQREAQDRTAVDIARAAEEEGARATAHALLEEQIHRRMAENDAAVRRAVAAAELAQDALHRAQESQQKFPSSVPERELETLKYEHLRSRLDVEQARHDQALLKLQADSAAAQVEQHKAVQQRLQLERRRAERQQAIAERTADRMRLVVAAAQEQLRRRHMTAPFSGTVVEQMRQEGEWVEAGDSVLRLIRIDVLSVDGFADADSIDQSFQGRPVSVTGSSRQGTVTLTGRLVFVSPEVDSVNGQVAVRAEVDNPERLLRPGQAVTMRVGSE